MVHLYFHLKWIRREVLRSTGPHREPLRYPAASETPSSRGHPSKVPHSTEYVRHHVAPLLVPLLLRGLPVASVSGIWWWRSELRLHAALAAPRTRAAAAARATRQSAPPTTATRPAATAATAAHCFPADTEVLLLLKWVIISAGKRGGDCVEVVTLVTYLKVSSIITILNMAQCDATWHPPDIYYCPFPSNHGIYNLFE